jgi:hypothetical protein
MDKISLGSKVAYRNKITQDKYEGVVTRLFSNDKGELLACMIKTEEGLMLACLVEELTLKL